jgi:hypothetical protein
MAIRDTARQFTFDSNFAKYPEIKKNTGTEKFNIGRVRENTSSLYFKKLWCIRRTAIIANPLHD